MRVGLFGLTVWSFLMASAHGAGLMVVPFVIGGDTAALHATSADHAAHAAGAGSLGPALAATGIHALGYLVVSALVAAIVYEKVGVAILRRAWVNLDLLWAAALIATGALTIAV